MSQPIFLRDRPRGLTDLFPNEPASDPMAQIRLADTKSFPLTMASEGERVRIQALQGGKGLMMRLTELGLNQGTELRIVHRRGGGLVVARGETRIALGGGMATKILVTAVAP